MGIIGGNARGPAADTGCKAGIYVFEVVLSGEKHGVPQAAFEVEERSPVAVVALSGDHDAYSAQKLEAELLPLAALRAVVVDLSGTSFIDSSTVSALLKAQRIAGRRGFALVVGAGTGHHVRRLLELTQLDGVLRVHASRHEAIDSLGAAA
jgi:anti-sigma B factor antagonist